MSQPNPQESRAVLIGTSDYDHMPPLPAVANNLHSLREALIRPDIWGLAPQHCVLVENPRDAEQMLRPVTDAADEASDALLVYVAGHGLNDRDGLRLALPSTAEPKTHHYTSVPFGALRKTVSDTMALRRVVILDCCYSGLAFDKMSVDDLFSEQWIEGSYVMASSARDSASIAPEGAEFTAFTGNLIETLRSGIANDEKHLTLNAISRHVRSELAANNFPPPDHEDRNGVGDTPFFRNLHHTSQGNAAKSGHVASGYGAVSGVEVGDRFATRLDLREAGLHRPQRAGICGSKHRGGAESIVVSGGYVDDEDHGHVIIYTGHGGQDNNNRQVRDQRASDPGNAALIASITSRYPVRVIRGAGGNPQYSPPKGFRYDGLYTVESYWSKTGADGFKIVQFRLDKLDLESPPVVPSGSSRGQAGIDLSRWEPVALGVYRDRRIATLVCRAHDYQCQVCGLALETPAGLLLTPTTHIKSLAIPHKGPDVAENVLCLCPTHRVQLDLGILTIEDDFTVVDETDGIPIGKLAVAKSHKVGLDFVRYHRKLYRTR